jgi:hypothetical protein
MFASILQFVVLLVSALLIVLIYILNITAIFFAFS